MQPLENPAPDSRPLQFGLKTIQAITSGFALFFAAGSWFGPLGYEVFFLLAWLATIFAIPGWSWNKFKIIGVCYLAFLFVSMYAMNAPQDAPRHPAARPSKATFNTSRVSGGKTIQGDD